MKLKIDKNFLPIAGIAVGGAFLVTIAFAILSLFSWAIVFAALVVLFLPLAQSLVEFYKKKNCMDLEDLWIELTEEEDEESVQSSIEW